MRAGGSGEGIGVIIHTAAGCAGRSIAIRKPWRFVRWLHFVSSGYLAFCSYPADKRLSLIPQGTPGYWQFRRKLMRRYPRLAGPEQLGEKP